MPRYLIQLTFILLSVTALSGLWIRLNHLFPATSFTAQDFLLHAHSHLALLGWAFLGVFLLFIHLTWKELKEQKQAIFIFISAFAVTILMGVAFLQQGYATWSILFSVLHIGIEYWMVTFIFRHIRNMKQITLVESLFLKGALISLLISSIGPFSLGGMAMQGFKDTAFFEMAIYFFLHFQYNGWLYLILVSLFLIILRKKGIIASQRMLTFSFWITFITLFPSFLLSVLWYDIGIVGLASAAVGTLGQLIGLLTLLFAIWKKREIIRQTYSQHLVISILFTFAVLLVKNIMEISLLYPPLATIVFETREVIVGYLHLTLLGFVSIFILTQFQMTGMLDETKQRVLLGVGIFILGFTLNEAVLFLSGMLSWFQFQFPFDKAFLLIAACGLLLGALMLWSSLCRNKGNQ